MVAPATDFSFCEFENSEMLENFWGTSALSLFLLYIVYSTRTKVKASVT